MGRASIDRPVHLSTKLVGIRERFGLSQNSLIRELGFAERLTQAEISAFEHGKRIPPLLVLLRYARLANIHVDDLIDDEISINR